jgi:hypothetical protein
MRECLPGMGSRVRSVKLFLVRSQQQNSKRTPRLDSLVMGKYSSRSRSKLFSQGCIFALPQEFTLLVKHLIITNSIIIIDINVII